MSSALLADGSVVKSAGREVSMTGGSTDELFVERFRFFGCGEPEISGTVVWLSPEAASGAGGVICDADPLKPWDCD